MKVGHLSIVRLGGDLDLGAEAHQRFREWLRNHQRIPRIQDPGIAEGHVEGRHGQRAGPGQEHGAGLGYVLRAARSVNGKHYGKALVELAFHAQQCWRAAAAARSPDRDEAKSFDGPRDIFAVEAAADHHRDAGLSP